MSDVDLSGYEITFNPDREFGGWFWVARRPDGTEVRHTHPDFRVSKANAERLALEAIRSDASRAAWKTEVVDGNTLAGRVDRRSEETASDGPGQAGVPLITAQAQTGK